MSLSKYSRSKYLAGLMLNADDASETKTEVDSLNKMLIYPCKTCARNKQRKCLPPEIVFEILLYLPAHVIHDVMTHVCKEWNSIIRTKKFIYDHLQNSTPGIIILEQESANTIYVEIRCGYLEICKFDCSDFHLCWNSVNGLLLATVVNEGIRGVLSIMNPLTKQQEPLPCDGRIITRSTLAFAEASMKYKAVRSFHSPYCISVLTIGVDNVWRYLDVQHLSAEAQKALFDFPFATRGYVHWIGKSSIVTMNVETEIIHEFALPAFHRFGSVTLAMGCNLSSCHLSRLPGSCEYLMEVMEMNSETGEWTKLLSSDLKPLSDRFKGLNSVNTLGVLADGEVFLFGISGSEKLCAAYNVRTREIQSFNLEVHARKRCSIAHMNTMIWYE